ncbi:glycosyltransferase family 2 protein [Salegentibacter sp. JZCK2]|uniref:glycosyltransferase family 2 protein n=1 Tax=Salegentibacter tibetensis TaxID=2873600 RepID=UPI001CCCA096|nr:glycosyltransferase family 2 protein [Salegentibacter tibetensis]MBZ9729748.1 glycosyltransferase family 2 protein [Salegentibacter tibetensis]
MIDLSIIYVNFNTRELTLSSIASVYCYTTQYRFEIIVVDNASRDNSVSEIQQKFPEVRIIQNKKNIGFGRANNKGLEIAKGKYVLFLNTDTYLEEPAIDGLLYEMEKKEYQKVAVAGAKLTKPDGSYNISSGLLPSFQHFIKGSFYKVFFKPYFYENLPERTVPIDNKSYKVDYVSGADFLIRRKVLDKIGGFDPRFFLYNEESELTFRIYKYFPKMISMIFPQYKIVHISQGSSQTDKLGKKFKHRQIKSRAIYYSITRNKLSGLIYYITSVKRLYLN